MTIGTQAFTINQNSGALYARRARAASAGYSPLTAQPAHPHLSLQGLLAAAGAAAGAGAGAAVGWA